MANKLFQFKPNEHWNYVTAAVFNSLEAAGYCDDRLRMASK